VRDNKTFILKDTHYQVKNKDIFHFVPYFKTNILYIDTLCNPPRDVNPSRGGFLLSYCWGSINQRILTLRRSSRREQSESRRH
jgi:hypothetical protein